MGRGGEKPHRGPPLGQYRARGPAIQNLDIATLLFAAALGHGVLAALMIFYAAAQRTYPGFRDWILLDLGLAAGFVVLMTYPVGRPPPVLLAVLVNGLLVAAADRLYRGMARFAGDPAGLTPGEMAVYATGAAVFTWFLVADPHFSARLAALNLCMAFATLKAAAVALRLSRGSYRAAAWLVVVVLGLGVTLLLARAGAALLAGGSAELMSRTGAEPGLLALLIAYGMSLMVSLLLLTAQRAQQELTEARAQVLTLEGIIPICMYCHKVRNDQEAWDRIETYISRHSAARFSHGICPECLPVQFPPGQLEDRGR